MTPARQPQECKTCIHDGKFETQCCVMSGHYYNVCAISKIQVIEGKPIIRCSTHTSAPAPEPDEIRPEVIAFAKVMEDTLRKHDGKKTHWRDVSVSFGYLFGRVSDEIREAKDEYHVHNPDYHKCVMELVDVANFCMMCYDRIHPADTRSRPHTQAPSQDELAAAYERGVRESSSPKHEKAEAAKAERERAQQRIDAAIEQLSDINKYAREEYEEANLSDNEREMRIHLEYGNRVWGVVRFLRAQPEPQQEGRR